MTGVAGPVEEDDRPPIECPRRIGLAMPTVSQNAWMSSAVLFEAPRASVAPVGTAVPAQIEVDDLGMLGEPAEVRLEVGMVIDCPGPP